MADILLRRHLLVILFLSILALSPSTRIVQAFIEPILVGTDPSGDANPASVDILKVSLMNNGTCFRFIVECRTTPAPSGVRAYRVYLDTKIGGETKGTYAGVDFYLQGGGTPGLYEWVSGRWIYKASTDAEVIGNSIYLTALLSDIGYPGNVQEAIGVVAATFQPLGKLGDRSPDGGNFSVVHEVIPELPGATPIVIIPAVLTAVYMIHKRRFKGNG